MKNPKALGIWLDHANAHLIEFKPEPAEMQHIESKFTYQVKQDSISKSESLMHNKEQHQQSEYYKQLGDIIRNYDEVLLFGPTNAKTELLNVLRADHLFDAIKIEVKNADKMTEQQQRAFVTDFFSN